MSAPLSTRPVARNQKDLARSIAKAIAFLMRSQLPYGEFKTYASSDETLKVNCRFDSSPFVTALVLYSIGFWENARVRVITTKGLSFLRSEMEGMGLWRYWSSRNQAHKFLPPDLDDTCCISFILKKYHEPLPQNREFILANRNSRGIFYTWMAVRADSSPKFASQLHQAVNAGAATGLSLAGGLDNIDCAINANVLLFLGEGAETNSTIDYLIDVVRSGDDACSEFYPDRLSFYYMLSRAYFNGVCALVEARNPLINKIVSSQENDGSLENELLTALAASTLLNFDYRGPALDRAIEYLLQTQGDDGAWRRIAMFLGPAPYYGSEELTTALCVEALARYWRLVPYGSTKGEH